MLGRRIRELRVRQGLSQQQLAGQELSRSLICRIEKGHCSPSPDSLRVIATRLGKPISYFMEEHEPSQEIAVDKLLYALEQRREQIGAAELPQLQTALNLARRLLDPALEARSLYLLGWISFRTEAYDQAIEQLEEAAELFQTVRQNRGRAESLNTAGVAAFLAEQLQTATRYFNRSLRLTAERKDLSELRARVLINLGSCLIRLGQHDEALRTYEEARAFAGAAGLGPALRGNARYGLGICWQQLGDLTLAGREIDEALRLFREAADPAMWDAQQVLASILSRQDRAAEAAALFAECQSHFHQQGEFQREASLLEDVAQAHLRNGNLGPARYHAEQALELLQQVDEGFVRARLYRLLGQVTVVEGSPQRARELVALSLELFRHLKSRHEFEQTEALLRELG